MNPHASQPSNEAQVVCENMQQFSYHSEVQASNVSQLESILGQAGLTVPFGVTVGPDVVSLRVQKLELLLFGFRNKEP